MIDHVTYWIMCPLCGEFYWQVNGHKCKILNKKEKIDVIYYYHIDEKHGGPWAVDIGKMQKDGWIFEMSAPTGQSYQIPGMGNYVHQVMRMVCKKDDKMLVLVSEWYGGINSGGEYWIVDPTNQ